MQAIEKNTRTSILAKSLLNFYIRDYGEIKSRKLLDNLESSKEVVWKFFQFWKNNKIAPNQKELQKLVSSINWFVFSRRETMAVACLILLTKWEEESKHDSEQKVFKAALSIIEYYKVYVLETNNIVASLSKNNEDILVQTKVSQLVMKIKSCIETGKTLNISAINQCTFTLKNGDKKTLQNIDCHINMMLQGKTKFGTNIFSFLPNDIIDTFCTYANSNGEVYEKSYICFDAGYVSNSFKDEVQMALMEKNSFVDLEGDIILMKGERNAMNMVVVRCRINESGILFSSYDFGWSIVLNGKVEEWKYSFQ